MTHLLLLRVPLPAPVKACTAAIGMWEATGGQHRGVAVVVCVDFTVAIAHHCRLFNVYKGLCLICG